MIVQAPDGKNIDFGDMAPDAVQAALQKLYPPQSALGTLNNSMQNTASFGMASPIEGLANAAAGKVKGLFSGQETPSFGTLYNEGREQYARTLAAGSEANPVSSGLGTGLGALGSIPVGKAVAAAPTVMGKIGHYITGNTLPGIGLGAVSGFGNAPGDIKEQAGGAGLGALIGGTLGTALPGAISGGGKVLSPLMQMFAKNPQAITPASTTLASKNIMDMMKRDNLTFADIPLDQNLLQAGGKAATGRAESIATRGTQGADMLQNYAERQAQALPNDLSASLGAPFAEKDYPALLDAIKERAKTDAGPAYEEAYAAHPSINDPQINEALDRAVAAGDWPVLSGEARQLAAYNGRQLGNLDATGTIRSFSTEDLDYMTRALRNLGQGTQGMGAFGNKTPLGGMRAGNAGSIRARLKEINPLFAKATGQYAGDIEMHEAAQAGKAANLFSNNWKQAVADYDAFASPAQQQAWRVGQAENLQTMIANNPNGALTKMNSPQFKKVMSHFYSPEEYAALLGSAQQLMKQRGQIRQITGNSRTAARAIQQSDDRSDESSLAQSMLASGSHSGGFKNFMRDKVMDHFVNTPARQSADRMVAQTLLQNPFQMAATQAGGNLPPQISGALTGNPLMQQMLLSRLQGPRNFYPASLTNLFMAGGQ